MPTPLHNHIERPVTLKSTRHNGAFIRGKQIASSKDKVSAFPIVLFCISLVVPFSLEIGPVLLSANRLLLLMMLGPCLFMWLRGAAGSIRMADIALILMWFWYTVSFLVIHGSGGMATEAIGVRFLETIGPFLLARCFIRDANSFAKMVRTLFLIVTVLFPFAIYETLTSHNILLEQANNILPSGNNISKDPRWGLDRVQGPFQHPILYGVFTGSILALVYYVLGYGVSPFRRVVKTSIVGIASLLSLSSGPLTGLVAQLALISWDKIFSSFALRWKVLASSVLSLVVALEIAANRSVPELFISYFAFSKWTAYNRIRIWDYGSLSVVKHPFFGIGRNEWERPYWMSSSMDMFWLVSAVRSGLPAALLLQLAFFSAFLAITFKSGLSERTSRFRTGYLICMVSLYLAGWTVDYWKTTYTLFLFLFGSGLWMLDADEETQTLPENDTKVSDRAMSYTRSTTRRVRKHTKQTKSTGLYKE